ncbi:DUF2190 family protein [Prescottella subtropica]|uniref:DUF2190 family protein n=1 Tax=Prescottella subtropica TaxID=2545757 RepID=UPI0010F87B54|nr:DUF2190 family protein [Prescottella subtropica]
MPNLSIDVYGPGLDITGRAAAAITAKRFLRITGNTSEGNVTVGHAPTGGRVCGVAKYDTASGDLVGIARGASRVVRVTAAGTVAAFAEVQVGADGKAAPLTDGIPVGYAITAAAPGTDALISLNS